MCSDFSAKGNLQNTIVDRLIITSPSQLLLVQMQFPYVSLLLCRSLFVSKSQHIVCLNRIFKTVLYVHVLLQHLYDIQLIKDESQKLWNWKSVGHTQAMQ